jgi:diketogulonate reductase-like aldo/keto reductase
MSDIAPALYTVSREGYEITLYAAAYKKKHAVITILAPGKLRTDDFYLSGRIWRDLQSKKRVPAQLEKQLKALYTELMEGQSNEA